MSNTDFDPSAIRATDESISRIVWFELPEGAPELQSNYGTEVVPQGGRIDWRYTPRGVETSITFFSDSVYSPRVGIPTKISVHFKDVEAISALPAELRNPILALIESFPTPILPQG